MKLHKALKRKNVLVGEIATLRQRVAQNNVYQEPNVPAYNSAELMQDIISKTDELVQLKTAITIANVPIQSVIYDLAELKGLVEFLRTIPVNESVVNQDIYGGGTKTIVYKSYIGRILVDQTISETEKEIQDLQDKLDEFNAITSI